MPQSDGFQQRLSRIDGLVTRLQSSADPALRAAAKELMESVMELHGAAMERLLEITSEASGGGVAIIDRFGADPLVGSLLVLYGLHPADLAARVDQALNKVRPYLKSRGAAIELVSLKPDQVQLRIRAEGCVSTSDSLRAAVEDAIYEAAPDVGQVVIDAEPKSHGNAGFVPLQNLGGLQPLRQA